MSSGTKGTENFFSALKVVNPPPPQKKYMANVAFLNPLHALIPNGPFSSFAEFLVQVTSRAWGQSRYDCGGPSIEPYFGEGGGHISTPHNFVWGGVQPKGCMPPPPLKARPPQARVLCTLSSKHHMLLL